MRRLGLVDVGEAAATAGLAVLVGGHEDTGAAGLGGALATETLDLAVRVDAVVLEDCHLDRLALVLDLLRGGVRLLLALLGHTTAQAEDEVEGRLLLDVVVRKSAAVLELLAGKDETLLVGGDALLVLDLGLDVVDRVGRLDLEGDRLAREGLDEDLHAAAEAEDEVERRLLLDVVVRKRAAVLELLAREDEALLIRRDALLVLDLLLHVVDRVRRLDVKRDGLAREGLDEDLHAAAQAEHEVEGRLLLDVVVRKRAH